jgi:hypothetical protein
LSGNQKKKGGVSLKMVKENIAEEWGFGLIPKPASIGCYSIQIQFLLSYHVIWWDTINSLWDTINDNWFSIINQIYRNHIIFSIPDVCAEILLKIIQNN